MLYCTACILKRTLSDTIQIPCQNLIGGYIVVTNVWESDKTLQILPEIRLESGQDLGVCFIDWWSDIKKSLVRYNSDSKSESEGTDLTTL